MTLRRTTGNDAATRFATRSTTFSSSKRATACVVLTAALVSMLAVQPANSAVKRKRTTTRKAVTTRATTTVAPVNTTTTTLAPTNGLERGLTKRGTAFTTSLRVTGRPVRIMPLGDDLTAGAGEVGAQSYRGYLYKSLQNAGFAIDFVGSASAPTKAGGDADHEGHGAYTIGPDDAVFCEWPEGGEKNCLTTPFNIAAGVDTWVPAAQPDVIVLNIGIYDLFEPTAKPGTSGISKTFAPNAAPAKLTALVASLRRLAPNAVIVVTSLARPSWVTSGWGPFEKLNAEAIRIGEAETTDAVLSVNLTAIPLLKSDYEDGFHVNDAGAAKLAVPLTAALKPVLQVVAG